MQLFLDILYWAILFGIWFSMIKYRRVVKSWTWNFYWAEKYLWAWGTYLVLIIIWLFLMFWGILFPFWWLELIFWVDNNSPDAGFEFQMR